MGRENYSIHPEIKLPPSLTKEDDNNSSEHSSLATIGDARAERKGLPQTKPTGITLTELTITNNGVDSLPLADLTIVDEQGRPQVSGGKSEKSVPASGADKVPTKGQDVQAFSPGDSQPSPASPGDPQNSPKPADQNIAPPPGERRAPPVAIDQPPTLGELPIPPLPLDSRIPPNPQPPLDATVPPSPQPPLDATVTPPIPTPLDAPLPETSNRGGPVPLGPLEGPLPIPPTNDTPVPLDGAAPKPPSNDTSLPPATVEVVVPPPPSNDTPVPPATLEGTAPKPPSADTPVPPDPLDGTVPKPSVTEVPPPPSGDTSTAPPLKETAGPPHDVKDHGEGKEAPNRPADLGANVSFDANHQISKIDYPSESKTREFGRDQNGEINKLITTTPQGKFEYVKEGDKWFLNAADGHKYPAADIMLDANGEFSKAIKDGVVLTQKPDGTSFEESVTALGARVKRNDQGQPELIKRSDGSFISASYEGGKLTKVVESDHGKPITWTPTGKDDNWTSDEQPPNTVQKLSIENNGNLTYTAENTKYIVRSNGAELKEGSGSSTYQFDDSGRFKSITTPDGKKTRSFGYEGSDSEPSTVRITSDGETKTFVHQPEQGGWTQVDQYNRSMGTWKGDVKITDDGTYAVKAEGTAGDAWMSYHPDGTAQMESRRANGSLAITNEAGALLSSTRPDGTVLKLDYGDGGLNQITQKNPSGDTISWKKQTDGSWKSDSPNYPDVVQKMSVNFDGELNFTDANKARNTLKIDGSSHMEKADGSFVDTDSEGLVRRVGIDKQNYRTLDYKDGELTKVTETTKAGTSTWERKPDAQEERKDIRVSSDGYVSYKVNGKTLVEGSNLSKMELNDNLGVTKVTMPNGSTRDYSYDERGSLKSITDQRVTAKGVKTETWNRVAEGTEGHNTFESRSADGKVKTREDVYPDVSGDYLYRTKDGKEHSARARDLLKAGEASVNVEDARASLEEMAEARGLKMDRLKKYMDTLEKRCKDGAEAGMKVPTDAQIAKTYDKFTELMKGTGGRDFFNETERKELVEQALYNLSSPTRINQGRNPTCNMTTGEIFIASRYPDKYADTLLQVGLTGKLKTTSGKEFTVARSALAKTQEEGLFSPDADYQSNSRNWASHIVQLYGINAFTKFAPPNVLPSWGHEYRGGEANPGMDGTAIRKSVKELTGGDMPYIEHLEAPSESKLWQYKKDGNFPIGIPTLYARMSDGSYGEQHVQTIHDVREVNGRTQVYLDDQNGVAWDRGWVDLSVVYQRQGLQGPPADSRSGLPKFTKSRR